MTGIKVDPQWVGGYAKTLRTAADELGKAAEALHAEPLGVEAFGELGKTVRTADSYQRAATTLREQLTRAVESLTSAADGLHAVVTHHTTQDEDNAGEIKRAHQR